VITGIRQQAVGNSKKLKLVVCVLCALFAFRISANAQQPKKVARIGYLSAVDLATESARAETIRLALGEFGYVEGQTIAIEYRFGEAKPARAPEIAAELVRLKVDVIVVAGGGGWVEAVKNATKTIPIVMVGPGIDPIEAGFVESLAHPGGNVTGITLLNRELHGKRLELLKEAIPNIKRVAVLYDPANRNSVRDVKEVLPRAARGLKLTIRFWEIGDANSLERVFAALDKERSGGLYALPSGVRMFANYKRIGGLAANSRLPSMFNNREAVETGGLMSYNADHGDSYRRVAFFVDKILKGAKPADLPVEQPTKFELVINLKTAKQIGITIPQELLARADRVIK
jgi:ABC-type uncharacterized transport system substrate-binding protein